MPQYKILFTTYQSFEKEFQADSVGDAIIQANRHWEQHENDANAYDSENPVELEELIDNTF